MCYRIWLWTVAGLFGLTMLAHGQWASIAYNPGNPIYVEGFHVTHDDGMGVQEFSAFNRVWHSIAPTDSTILGTGDWTTLVRDTAGNYRGYSARVDHFAFAAILPGSNLIAAPVVADDVILILAFDLAGNPEAHAYSAQTNQWQVLALNNVPGPADYAVSRFVICIRDGNVLHGFGARTGAWTPVNTNGAAPPIAKGNVAAADALDFGMNQISLAFSGVLGAWAASPIRHQTSVLKVRHNVASIREDAGALGYYPCAYSAYNGSWTSSATAFPVAPTCYDGLDDNVVYFGDTNGPRLEAIGARPGLVWDPIPAGAATFVISNVYDDAILVDDGSTLYAFSGLAAGLWRTDGYAGGGASFPGTGHLVLHQDSANDLHTFSPALAAWAPPAAIGGTALPNDAVALADTSADCLGYAVRWNQWNSTPRPAGAIMTTTGGSIGVVQEAASGDLTIWDERRNEFVGPFNAGGVSNMVQGRNLMLFESTTAVCSYSVQRSHFEQALGVVLPLGAPPVAEENVAMFVDGAGQLYAYGSPVEEHIWFAYPNCTEYQTFAPPGMPGLTFVAYSIMAIPGSQAAWILSPARLFTGLPGPWVGLLWLDLSGFWFMDGPFVVAPPPPPNFHRKLLLPAGAAMNVQFWTQGLTAPPVTLTMAPDPFWIF